MKTAVVALLVTCLAQGNYAQWALHRQVGMGSTGAMGGMGAMSGMGSMGMGGMGGMSSMGMGRMGGISSLSMNQAFPNAGLRAVSSGPLGPITAGNSWDCLQRTGMLSMCAGAAGAAAAAFDDYDTVEEESPIGPGYGLLTIAGQVGAEDEEAGKRAMAEIRNLFGVKDVPKGKFEGNVIGPMDGHHQLSEKAEAMIASAISGMPDSELASNAESLTNDELLDTVRGAQTAVTEQSKVIEGRINKLTSGPMALQGCAQDLVAEATALANSFSQVPDRAVAIMEEATVFHTDCSNQAMYQLQVICKTQKLVPVAVEAAQLARDVNSNTGKATELMKKLRGALKHCRENGIN